jgi:RimJ/RimL family protein N-acetyltransferase
MSDPTVPGSAPRSMSTPAVAKPVPDGGVPAHWSWVPIRSLGPRHRDRIVAHLVALNETDRYMRFGYPATDAQMSKYVDMLDFDNDEVFGIFNRRLELIAMAHLANAPASSEPGRPRMSEFGVSVLSSVRGRGFGARLFERATLHARNRGVDTLFIHALSENMAMLRIARNAGAVVERSGSESDAWLKLPPDSIATQVNELVEHQAAEIDYRFKVHAHRVNTVLDTISEVAAGIKKSAHIASE